MSQHRWSNFKTEGPWDGQQIGSFLDNAKQAWGIAGWRMLSDKAKEDAIYAEAFKVLLRQATTTPIGFEAIRGLRRDMLKALEAQP